MRQEPATPVNSFTILAIFISVKSVSVTTVRSDSATTVRSDTYWILPNLTRFTHTKPSWFFSNIVILECEFRLLTTHFARTFMVFNVTFEDGTTIDMPYGGDFIYIEQFQNILIQRPNSFLYASLRN